MDDEMTEVTSAPLDVPDTSASTDDTKSTYSEAEYEMLRTEILQYMEEYQNLRNMMYVGTVALLGFNSSLWENVYFFLLPLVIILPSYIIYFDYWKSVTVASVYMQLFLENASEGKSPNNRRWETMHAEFGNELNRKYDGSVNWRRHFDPQWSGMQCHKIPYVVCTLLCLVLYWYFVIVGSFKGADIDTAAALPLGIFVSAVSLIVFVLYRKPNKKTIAEVWQQTKDRLDRTDGEGTVVNVANHVHENDIPARKEEEQATVKGFFLYLKNKL